MEPLEVFASASHWRVAPLAAKLHQPLLFLPSRSEGSPFSGSVEPPSSLPSQLEGSPLGGQQDSLHLNLRPLATGTSYLHNLVSWPILQGCPPAPRPRGKGTATSAQPAALWALGSEARQFTARGCHLHTAWCLAPQLTAWRVPESTSGKNCPVRGLMRPPRQAYVVRFGDCTPQLGKFGAGSTPPLNKARGPRFPLNSPCTGAGSTPPLNKARGQRTPQLDVHWRGESRRAETKPKNISL